MQLRTLTAGIDTNIRYLPVLHELQQQPHYTTLLEVGSGSEGIARFVKHSVVGADVHFPTPPLPNLQTVALTDVYLPFRDCSFDVVVSTDTLEHIVPHQRATMVSELIRVSKQRLFLAVPTGKHAAEQDKKLDALYAQKHGKRHPFLIEHVEYGLPTVAEIQAYLAHALHVHQRRAQIRVQKNYNLWIRELETRLWLNPSVLAQRLFQYIKIFSLLYKCLSFGECYRRLFIVEIESE